MHDGVPIADGQQAIETSLWDPDSKSYVASASFGAWPFVFTDGSLYPHPVAELRVGGWGLAGVDAWGHIQAKAHGALEQQWLQTSPAAE